MLVLTRKVGECLTIGNDIKITVIDVKGKQVKVGISAPPEYIIYREEVYERVQKENALAAGIGELDLKHIAKLWKESGKRDTGKRK